MDEFPSGNDRCRMNVHVWKCWLEVVTILGTLSYLHIRRLLQLSLCTIQKDDRIMALTDAYVNQNRITSLDLPEASFEKMTCREVNRTESDV